MSTPFLQLCTILSDFKRPSEVQSFLEAFLTESECQVLARRFAILLMLNQGYSYETISRELKVSSATISAIAGVKDTPAIRQALKLWQRDSQLSSFLTSFFQR